MAEPVASTDIQQHRRRAAAAWQLRNQWQTILDDAYDFVAPHRLSTRQRDKAPGNRVDRIFDPTAVVAHERATARLQQDLFPTGEPFFALELGPAAKAQDNADDLKAEAEKITARMAPAFLNGDWDQAIGETIGDALISRGALLVLKGDAEQPVRFVNVSLDELAFDMGPYNRIEGIFWKRKWSYRAIKSAFPKGKFDSQFNELHDGNPEAEVMLAQDTVWDQASKRWKLRVYLESSAEEIWTDATRECPWITPCYRRLPGQAMGFGPVLMALPTTKTVNKVVEITLKAAALTMGGIFTRVDDGVFNPDTARIEPGAMWTVARNGGTLGPSLQKLAPPGDINVSNIVLQDLRMQVSSIMGDQQLPPDSQPARSAAEIVERIKRLAQDRAGAGGRIMHETVIPVVRRVMEIYADFGLIDANIKIDQLMVQVRVTSPLAMAYRADRAQKYIQWVELMNQAGGPELTHLATQLDIGMAEVGEDLGVPEHLINSIDERKSIASTVAAAVQQALAAQAKQNAPPPPANGDPAQGQAAMAA